MIISTWPVNQKFFAFSDQPKSNTQQVENLSGRVVTYQKNTKKIMTFTCSIKLKVKTELPLFWDWYNDTLGQTAGGFTCAALGDGVYHFVSTPNPQNTDTVNRILNLEIEELF